ncbi:M48 family metallopeptidase [Phytohabitans kaempferiae]|uniref:M48 family metallopeptidase n=1 Tax=Phytohabitans kaempferiae TaxID=1620943 RepID=A0ABV6LWE7_9ACTN
MTSAEGGAPPAPVSAQVTPGPRAAGACARCGVATTSIRDAEPWCPRCEWGLDRYEPARRHPEFGWQWVDRRTHRLAYRLTRHTFQQLISEGIDRRGGGLSRAVTVVASLLLLVLVALLVACGVWLLVHDFPALTIPFGLAALGLAYALRPRFGRLDSSAEVLDRERAPALFRLVGEVAAAVGAPVPDVVAVDGAFGAYATAVGLRRTRVLCIGLPLWAVLSPQERVALVAHELGHFVSGDVRRGLLTQPALTMLGAAADLVRPVKSSMVETSGLGVLLAEVVQRMLARLLFTAHVVLVGLGQRDAQRAEYLADEMSAKVAGSTAAASLADVLLVVDAVEMVVRRDARAGRGPAEWRGSADEARASAAASLPALRQLSVRDDASLFASHPPSGLRWRMIRERPQHAPTVALTEARLEPIESELARHYERIARDISWGG